jgi:hypothetical protein
LRSPIRARDASFHAEATVTSTALSGRDSALEDAQDQVAELSASDLVACEPAHDRAFHEVHVRVQRRA